MKRIVGIAGIAVTWLLSSGHVGSPDAWFEGAAGPYHVVVQVVPAGVVPGVATVNVRVVGDKVSSVSIQTNRFDATGGAPPPEPTTESVNEAGLFSGKLWIMAGGSNSVIVNVSGAKGTGTALVPVVISPFARLELGKKMSAGLMAMGAFLFVGLVTIIGAAVRESSLPPGDPATPATRRRARNAMVIATALLGVALFGGWKWWTSEDESFVRSMYKPMDAAVSLDTSGGSRAIAFRIADSAWVHRGDTAWLRARQVSSWTPLVEDHGKLMHMFAVSSDMSAFAHLHPTTVDSVTFTAPMPDLPAGKYRVFADIVHESGFNQTLVSSVDVGASASPTATANPDDSWFNGPVAGANGRATLDDGSTVEWKRSGASIAAGKPASLTFDVRNSDGTPATLEPYMGMAAHAVVQRSDGSVFVHLHPMGTISMASQMTFQMRQPGDTIRGRLGKRVSSAEMTAMSHSVIDDNIVSFPYAFPKEGNYRVWVQVKRGGKVMTAAFDASVAQSAAAD